MARSLLGSFVGGTRAMLTAQLFISVSAVALTGWTLAVTNDLIRERERLRERVIQLEGAIAERGDVVPSPGATVQPPAAAPQETTYPGRISEGAQSIDPVIEGGTSVTISEDAPPAPAQQPEPAAEEPPAPATPTPREPSELERGIGQILTDLFTPAPALSVVVLHARNENDAAVARRLAAAMAQTGNVRFLIETMAPRDPRQSGYAYYDGRQSRAASAFMQQFHDAARRQEIATWSAQLRGTALPTQGEYTAERLDIVLPPLPTAGTRGASTIDASRFRETPATRIAPPPPPPPIR